MIAPSRDRLSHGHICVECGVEFTGHKRRPNVCNVCSKKKDAEIERRAGLLAQIGLDRKDWVLIPKAEWDTIVGGLVRHIVDSGEERALRRKLATALKTAHSTNSSAFYWDAPYYHHDTSESLLAESASLDKSLEEREKKGK